VRRTSKALVAALTLLVTLAVAQAIADTAPTPTIQGASEISYTSAKLKGKVNPNGGPSTTTWQFQYSSEGTEGPWTPGPEGNFEGAEAEENTALSVEGELSGLKPNTTYYTRLVATNEGGQSSVSAPSFATLEVAAPSATIEAVSAPGSSSAQLVGHINPNAPEAAPTSPQVEAGFSVSWHFQCTPDCGNPSGSAVAADNAEHEVSAEASGLLPGIKYKVSLVAENAGTSASAGPEEFTTEANAPTINSVSFSDVTTGGATLRAAIDPSGAPTTYRFEYTDDADFEANGFDNATKVPVPDANVGSAPGAIAVSQAITGLDPATKYDFRVVASNFVDSAESEAKSFTTFATSTEGQGGQFPGQGFLPDNRAWEMVSPPDKHGGNVAAVTSRTHAAADGEAVTYVSSTGFADVQGTVSDIEYLSRRDRRPGTNGWSTHAITPRQSSLTLENAVLGGVSRYHGDFSADLSRAVFQSVRPLTDAPKAAETPNLYLRTDLATPGAGSYRLLSEPFAAPPPQPPINFLFFGQPYFGGASTDFNHVIFESALGLTEGTSFIPNQYKLYENASGSVRLVGRVPKEPEETSCDDTGGSSVECVNAPSSQAGISASIRAYPARMISADGSRIFFQSPAGEGGKGGNIYLREDGIRTFLLNASEKEPPAPPAGEAQLWDASRDGSRVFFTTGESLVEEDEDGGNSDLYMYEVDKPEGERLTVLSDGAEEASGVSVIGASDDGHYVYFISSGQLVAGEPAGVFRGLYVWHDGDISYLGSFPAEEPRLNTPRASWLAAPTLKTSRVTPDGRHLLFMAKSDAGFKGRGGFAGYDHGGNTACVYGGLESCRELYTYNAETAQLRCASCNPSGATATADALTDVHGDPGPIPETSHLSHALADDGRYVFFSTAERLVTEDTNGTSDAYSYDTTTEEARLLSSGEDKGPSYFVDASADGSDVFIATAERLSRWDTDTSYDIYDARVGGGLPEPVPPPPSCQGDACQPTPVGLNDPTPASSSFKGAGNPHKPLSRCAKGKRRVKTRNGKSRCVKRHAKKQHRTAKHNRRAGR
jgi:hypothetical protein